MRSIPDGIPFAMLKISFDLWSEIIRSEEEDGDGFREVPQVEVYQRRKKLEKPSAAENLNRVWSREGSIAVGAYVNNQPQKKPVRRKKPAPLGNVVPSVGGVWCYLSL
ncbi:hypothetical protein YC2023_017382 [Brassica napus]